MGTHTGTHVDAPRHFFDDKPGVDSLPLELLVGRARVIDLPHRGGITEAHLGAAGLREDLRVLLKTPNSALWNSSEGFHSDYTYLTEGGAKFLVDQGVKVVGVDYLSVEQFKKAGAPAHHQLLGERRGRHRRSQSLRRGRRPVRDVLPASSDRGRGRRPGARRPETLKEATRCWTMSSRWCWPEASASGSTRSRRTAPSRRSISAGPYRIIDFTLSNCLNSGLRKVFIALQYKSLSLTRHLRFGWSVVADELGEFIEVLHPQKRVGEHWYQGTADAVYQNLYSIQREEPRHLIVLSGDHVYKMDYARMLRFHLERGAGATLARARGAGRGGGSLRHPAGRRRHDRLTGFLEKPKDLPPGPHLASMGIYIFDMSVLVPALEADAREATSHDFGKDIIPSLISQVPVYAYRFTDENKKTTKYWRDIGTLDAYYEANMDLCRVNPEFNLYDPEWPLRTHQVQAPPAKFVFADEGRRCGTSLRLDDLGGLHHLGQLDPRQRALPERARPQLLRGRRQHPDARTSGSGGTRASAARSSTATSSFHAARQVGYNEAEDRKRHTVTESGIVVVTKADEPFIGPISDDALRIEAEFDYRGSQ